MHCAIYKGHKKIDHYLYVEQEGDFSRVPESLLAILGNLELVMTLELGPERTLAQADINQVRHSLREQGYYFQMPPQTTEPPLNA
ncbi:YcgL domain-containing protein [Kaarinaea lacus]